MHGIPPAFRQYRVYQIRPCYANVRILRVFLPSLKVSVRNPPGRMGADPVENVAEAGKGIKVELAGCMRACNVQVVGEMGKMAGPIIFFWSFFENLGILCYGIDNTLGGLQRGFHPISAVFS